MYCDKKNKDSWRQILLGQCKLVHRLLKEECPTVKELKEFNSILSEKDAKYCQETLVRSCILNKIESHTRIRWNWDNFVLYPDNSKTWHNRYFISKRNEILTSTEAITIDPIHWMIDKIPFLKGDYISFTYKKYTFRWQTSNWVDMYDGETKLSDKGGDYEQLHTQFSDSNDYKLANELDRRIEKYEEIKEAYK